MQCLMLLCLLATAVNSKTPNYETLDPMQTSESGIAGYQLNNGGYIPSSFGGFGQFNSNNFGYYQPYFRPHHHIFDGISRGFADRNIYSSENKNINGQNFQNAEGNSGVSTSHGNTGFSKGEVAVKDNKADTGFYKDESVARNGFDDAKYYQGGQHYNNRGENDQNQKQNQNHKKGHSSKGFKTSHHKDENGKTETFYDEAHDEGGNYNYQGTQGAFGEKEQSGYKGGHDNGQFVRDEKAKQGDYDTRRVLDNTNADKGAYDQKGFRGNGQIHRINSGIGQHSLLGRQEANREFYHQHPYGYHPINSEYY